MVKLISFSKTPLLIPNEHYSDYGVSQPDSANSYSFSSYFWIYNETKIEVHCTWGQYASCSYTTILFVSPNYGTGIHHNNWKWISSNTYFAFYSYLISCWSWGRIIDSGDLDSSFVASPDFDRKMYTKKTHNAILNYQLDTCFNFGNHSIPDALHNLNIVLKKLE